MKNLVAPVLSALVNKHQTTNPRLTTFKNRAVKTFARGLSVGLCLMLLVQCLALLQPVTAKSRQVSAVANNKKKQKNRKKKQAVNTATASSEQAKTRARKTAITPAAKQAEALTTKKNESSATQNSETVAARSAEARATREAEALAQKEARELAKKEAAELAKKKAEDRAKQQDEDRAGNRQLMGAPYGLALPANQAINAPVSGGQDNAASVPQAAKEFAATNRAVEDLGAVNMAALSRQKGMIPSSAEPVELKAIHPPQDAPSQGREAIGKLAVAKESKKKKESLDSPISSIPSPMMSRTFKSDSISLLAIPPDTMGAVGLNHVVTTTNEKILIHNRNGVLLSSVTLNAFWAATPNGLATPSTFDPKILYDRFNDRFIMVTQANSGQATSATLVATSFNGDPTGSWNRYAIDADSTADGTGGAWADYPSIGFNKNWIVISVNRFGYGNRVGFQGVSVYVINKTTAYTGILGTVSVFDGFFAGAGCLTAPGSQQPFLLGCGFTLVPAITEDNTTNDEYIVEDWDPQFGQLRMTRVTGTLVTPTLTVGYQFPQSPYAWKFNGSSISGSGGYMPERQQNAFLVSGNRPTANDSRIQNAVLRNGSFWTTHHVFLARTQTPASIGVGGSGNPDIRTAIQWWQIDPLITNTTFSTPPIQRNIIADPRADNCHNGSGGSRAGCAAANQVGDFYSFPTISVNANNDVLIGYSRFSPFTLPKTGYSFRSASDPQNTMRDSITFREGLSTYTLNGSNPVNIRWGDYSATMVDPVNDTDFWTIQEHSSDQREIFGAGNGFASTWETWWAAITPAVTAPYAFNSGLIISEFRMRGPAGPRDEFVELVNNTNSPITISTTDASDGWTLVYSDSAGVVTPLAVIPNGTVIPAHGHYLITNEIRVTGTPPYSLSANPTGNPVRTADSDAMYTSDMADNGGYALFRTSNQANFLNFAVVDAVGFASLPAGSIYREGNGLATCSGAPASGEQVSFVRKGTAGNPQDTGANENDFIYTSSTGASAQNCQVTVTNGAPTPLNRDSPPSP
ncbi:MAG TPA: hypothetical protein DC047_03055 [Blastocatellia bacterium]|nr:hypothetical protein [Blastocatellia bacterium]